MTNDLASGAVTYALDADVAVIRIDDGKANALSHAIIADLDVAFARATSEAKAVALVGRDGKFSAGFDLTTMQAGPEQARDLLRAGAEVAERIFSAPIPVVAGCTGHALAMGAILLFCVDVRIGAEGPFKIGLNEVAIGMPLPRFAVELARERLSKRHLTAATNLAHIFTPAGAVDAGFLDRIAAPAAVESSAIAEAASLAASLNPAAFRLTREYLRADVAQRALDGLAADVASFSVT